MEAEHDLEGEAFNLDVLGRGLGKPVAGRNLRKEVLSLKGGVGTKSAIQWSTVRYSEAHCNTVGHSAV